MTDTNTDPEAIARRIVEFDARYQATRSLPLGNSERRDAFLSAMQSSIDDAPTLAAAYLDLRAQLDESEARRVTARQERDAAVRALRRCVITRFRGLAAVPLRAQLDAVTAQRDELREAAIAVAVFHGPACEDNDGEYCSDYLSGHCDACVMDARLQAALESAR